MVCVALHEKEHYTPHSRPALTELSYLLRTASRAVTTANCSTICRNDKAFSLGRRRSADNKMKPPFLLTSCIPWQHGDH